MEGGFRGLPMIPLPLGDWRALSKWSGLFFSIIFSGVEASGMKVLCPKFADD